MSEPAFLFRMFSLPVVSSTMDEARRIAEEDFPGAALVRADTQSAGRGRLAGRQWVDAPGSSLLVTMLMPSDFRTVEALPLRAGLGILRALESDTGKSLLLKWPNDVLAPPRWGKLCGILCENSKGRVLIGFGINIKKSAHARANPSFPAASIEELCGFVPSAFSDLDAAAQRVARSIMKALQDSGWHEAYESCLWARGSSVQFDAGHPDAPKRIEGILEGVDDEGKLILRVAGQRKTFASGELSHLRSI